MKQKTVFKVVRTIGKKIYLSAVVGSPVFDTSRKYTLWYAIGKKTIPIYGRIFVFHTLKDAQYFLCFWGQGNTILSCLYTGKKISPKKILAVQNLANIKSFWERKKGRLKYKTSQHIPQGSVLVKDVTPIGEVTTN